jgi:hypothetical protein
VQLLGHRLDLRHGLECGHLAALRLRVGDEGRRVLVEELDPDRVVQDLP